MQLSNNRTPQRQKESEVGLIGVISEVSENTPRLYFPSRDRFRDMALEGLLVVVIVIDILQ